MGFDIDELLKKDEFQKLGQERIEVFKTLAAELSGKKGPESVNILMRFNKVMADGPALSKDEQAAMIKIMLENLSPEDKQKYQAIIKYISPSN